MCCRPLELTAGTLGSTLLSRHSDPPREGEGDNGYEDNNTTPSREGNVGVTQVTENQIVTTASIPTFRHVLLKETDFNSDKPNCRICQGTKNGKGKFKLVAPCACRGSSEYVHKKCLRKWCATKRSTECEICNKPYHPRFLKAPSMPKSDEDSLVSSTMLLFLLIGVFAVSVYLLVAHLYAVHFEFTGDCWLLLFLVLASLSGLLTFIGWFVRNFKQISNSRKEQLREAYQLVPLNTVTSDPVSPV